MNFFGMFFSFMIPGILLGMMAASVLRQQTRRRRAAARAAVRRRALYVCDLRQENAA